MARQSLRSFAAKLRAFEKDLPRQQLEIKKQVILEVAAQVVEATPLDTGQAQNNYFFSIGSPDAKSVDNGPFRGARGGTNSLNRAVKITAQLKSASDDVYMTNNLPYIGRLNNGYSAQAPARFVETAVAKAKGIIKRQRLRWDV